MNLYPVKRSLAEQIAEFLKKGGEIKDMPPEWLHEYKILETFQGIVRTHKSTKVSFGLIKEIYPDMGVSTIYRYLKDTKDLLGTQFTINKEFERMLVMEMSLEDRDFARKLQDARAAVEATKCYGNAAGVFRDDKNEIDASKVQQHHNVIVFVGGADKKQKALSLKDLKSMPAKKRDSLISQITEALLPEEADFINVKNEE